MARKKPQPAAEPPPTVPAPAAPAESVTHDAPPAVAGGFRFNVHLSGPDRWPTLTVEAADAGDAIAKYRAECGIHETTHPFVAEPATT
jgi:hypothetical protein